MTEIPRPDLAAPLPLRRGLAPLFGLLALSSAALPAHALPSYARQTGEDCASCHIGAFGPQLTARGMRFKMGGYVDSNGSTGNIPLSAMLLANWTHTKTDQPPPSSHFKSNNNAVVQETSVFLAGKLADHLGSFVQATYSGVDRKAALDQVDLRYARSLQAGGKDLLLGVSLNNNPTVQDPFNSTASWRFPYTTSDFAPTPAVSPLIDGGLAGGVLGLAAYGLWDGSFYGEIGGYRSLDASTLNHLNIGDPGKVKGTAPYWRVAYLKDNGTDAYSAGMFMLDADLDPARVDGPYDKHRSMGLDASYQYIGDRKNIFALNGSLTHERTKYESTAPGEASGHLNSLNLSASYHYDETYGLTLGLFDTKGNNNPALWNAVMGNDRPDSRGYTLQADWTPLGKDDSWGAPWANLRLGLQYTGYSKFDGTSVNAKDNNSLTAFVWAAF